MAPCYIDAYLIRNCPFDFIQNNLKFMYGDEHYNLIKEDKLYTTSYRQNESINGNHIKCIKHPPKLYNKIIGCRYWFVTVIVPNDYVSYSTKYNRWDFYDEFVINHSSCCVKYKSIRAVKRAIRKWNLPVGSIITCLGMYIEDIYKFEVIK